MRTPSSLKYGPLNKSLYTQTFELIIKCLLHIQCESTLYIQRNALHLDLNDVTINLSKILDKTNFSHLYFDFKDSLAYGTYHHVKFTDKNDEPLSAAEKKCLRAWSGESFESVNAFLYNPILYFTTNNHDVNAVLNILLMIAFASSAVNKMDSKEEELGLYRGEKSTSQWEIKKRIKLIEQGGGITKCKGYLSTSSSNLVTTVLFARFNTKITFEKTHGKSIKNYAVLPYEREYLFVPGRYIFWQEYVQKYYTHFFKAEIVEPLFEEEKYNKIDLARLDDLITLASSHPIALSFLSESTKSLLRRSFTKFSLREKIEKGQIESLDRFTYCKKSMLYPLNSFGQTALHLAAISGRENLFYKILNVIKSNFDKTLSILNSNDKYGLTPIDYFVMQGREDVYESFIITPLALIKSQRRILQVLVNRDVKSCLEFISKNSHLVIECLEKTSFCEKIENIADLLLLYAIKPEICFPLFKQMRFQKMLIEASRHDKQILYQFFKLLPLDLVEDPAVKEIVGLIQLELTYSVTGIAYYIRYLMDKTYRESEQKKQFEEFKQSLKENFPSPGLFFQSGKMKTEREESSKLLLLETNPQCKKLK